MVCMSGRINISLTGEDADLFEDLQRRTADKKGKPLKNPKVVTMCVKRALEQRTMVMCAWTEIMVGMINGMKELGVDEDAIKVIQWCNLLLQQVLTNNVPPNMALQMTAMADDWIRDRKQELVMEYEESLQEAMG